MTQLFPRQTAYGSAAQAITATGDILKLQPGRPVIVVEWGFIVTTALSGTAAVLTANLRPTAGSTSGQTVGASSSSTGPAGETQYSDTAGGQMTTPTSLAAGKVAIHRVFPLPAQSGSVSGNTGSTSTQGVKVLPGQEFAINVGTAQGSTGNVTPYVTYIELPSVGDANAQGSNNDMANVSVIQS